MKMKAKAHLANDLTGGRTRGGVERFRPSRARETRKINEREKVQSVHIADYWVLQNKNN